MTETALYQPGYSSARLAWCARSINLRRDKLAQLGLSPPLQEKLRTHCTRREAHYKKSRNHYLSYENRKCDEKFEINHDVFESSGIVKSLSTSAVWLAGLSGLVHTDSKEVNFSLNLTGEHL